MWTMRPGTARAAHLSAAESLRSPLLQQLLVMGTFGFDRVPRQLAQAFLHVARVRRYRRCGGEPCKSRTTIPGKRAAKGHRLWLAVVLVAQRRVRRKGREVNCFLKHQLLACGVGGRITITITNGFGAANAAVRASQSVRLSNSSAQVCNPSVKENASKLGCM